MKKVLLSCVVSASLALSSVAFAATTPAKPAAEADKAKSIEQVQPMFKGIIKKHKKGTALITEDKTYQLAGGDFSKMVGKSVNIIGKVSKEGDVEKLLVAKLEVQQ